MRSAGTAGAGGEAPPPAPASAPAPPRRTGAGGRGPSLLGKAILVGVSTLAALAAVEIVLRLTVPPPPGPEDTLRTFTEYDADLGWRGRPHARGRYRTARFSIGVALNGGGWRDEEPPSDAPGRDEAPAAGSPGAARRPASGVPAAHRPPGTAAERPHANVAASPAASVAEPPSRMRRRIAVLGDSFAWGYGVERGQSFADRLEASLPGWTVQNYGISGYGTDQELLVLRRSALRIRPDIVIVEFAIGNDVENILASRAYHLPKPRFVLYGDGGLRLTGTPVPRTENWDRAAKTGVRDFLTAHVRLYAWARPRWASLRPRVGRLIGMMRDDSGGLRVRMLSRAPDARVQEGWRLAEAILKAMRDDVAAAGAELVVLVVPDRIQVEDDLWDQAVREMRLDAAAYDRSLPDRKLEEIGRRLGVLVVDPLPELRARERTGASLFIPDDAHWSVEGHAIAAEALRREIEPVIARMIRPDPE